MREIKFRTWDIEKKKFHYPKLWDNSMPSNWDKFYILNQYTGLKDKNGKEIFEGDIVNMHFFIEVLGESLGVMEGEKEIIGEIVIGEMGIWIQGNNEDDCGYLLWFNGLHEESFEVLGNIYEHPHLLSPQVKTRLK